VVVPAGVTCTLAVRFVTDVVAVAVLVSVRVSVFAGCVTVRVSVVTAAVRVVLVSLVVEAATAVPPALTAIPPPMASATAIRASSRVDRRVIPVTTFSPKRR
jgi:hypothetical protein